jgi:2-hydroxy-3-oxopropionate reductase
MAAGSVGFIGLGTMGREMVINLLKAGHSVRVYDVRAEAMDELASHGAVASTGPADAAREADIAISMLPDTPQVEEIVYGAGGLLEDAPRGRLIVDMSTISPVAVRRMSSDLAAKGVACSTRPSQAGRSARPTRRFRSWSAARRRRLHAPSPSFAQWAPRSRMSARRERARR